MRSPLAGVLSAFAITTCATSALADEAYRFTVPYNVTLPPTYSGPMILNVRCGVGTSAMSFDAATGVVSYKSEESSTQVVLATSSQASVGLDVKGQSKDSQAAAAAQTSQLQAMSQLSQSNSMKSNSVSESQANLAATAAQSSQLNQSQMSQIKGTYRQYNGTATVVLPAQASLIGGIGPPTTYVCWGQVGTGTTYTAAPFVRGTLPTVIR